MEKVIIIGIVAGIGALVVGVWIIIEMRRSHSFQVMAEKMGCQYTPRDDFLFAELEQLPLGSHGWNHKFSNIIHKTEGASKMALLDYSYNTEKKSD